MHKKINMKPFSFLLIALFFVVNTTQAQVDKKQLSANVVREIALLKKADLNLTEVQLSRITLLLNSFDEMSDKTMKTLEGNKAAQKSRLDEIKKSKINNVRGAMTPQQVEKFDALQLENQF